MRVQAGVAATTLLLLAGSFGARLDAQSSLTATLTYPIAGAVNADLTLPFQWTSVPNVQAYYLYVGTAIGAKDLVNTGEILQTSYLASSLPLGQTLYARLWTKVAGAWQYTDSTFTAGASASLSATITYPVNGAVNADLTQPIQWTSVPNVQTYYLYVGTTPGAKDLVNTGEILRTSYLASNLPPGQILYARLWTKVAGVWRYADSTFTAGAFKATLTYPANGAVNADLTQPIQWTSVPNVQTYYLYVGTTLGAKDLVNTGEILQTSYFASSLPAGQILYARLWTKIAGVWRYADSTFTAASLKATLMYPAEGAVNADLTQPFQWTSVASVQAYYLYVGTTLGAKDLVNTGEILQTSYLASSLPSGQTLYARMWTKTGGVWRFNDSTFSAAPPPSMVGRWSAVIAWPDVAIHAHLLNTGKILSWQSGATATVWDPASGTFTAVPNSFTNLLCVGNNFLPDGRLITIGGAGFGPGVADVNLFDPQSQSWSQASPMAYARWYPSLIIQPNGQPMAISGAQDTATNLAPTPESYSVASNSWTLMTAATKVIPYYAFTFILPDGRLFAAGASEQAYGSQVYDFNTQVWSAVDPQTYDGGSAVMYQPGKILKAGSASDGGFPPDPSSAAAYVIDMTQVTPLWRQVGTMAYPRSFLNLTVLPTGDVLATGGGITKDGQTLANAVLPAEMWSPVTETWTTMASMATPRLYHSEAVLLPDGRVFVGGGGGDSGIIDQLSAEIYSPPYLFKGPRPVIGAAPSSLAYGTTFTVSTPDAASIASVVLISPGSVTHSFNMNQHVVSLAFAPVSGGLSVTAPANANLATPGDYMLFLVNTAGVPSVATFVNLPVPSP